MLQRHVQRVGAGDVARAAGAGSLRADRGLQFVVVNVNVDFLRPAVLHDEILVTATLERLAGATIHFKQTIERGGEQLIDATVRVACLDSGALKPRAIPKDLFTEWRNAQ